MDREWTVGPDELGQRLDLHLAQRLGISRAAARRLLARGLVHCATAPGLAKGDAVQPGWRLRVDEPAIAAQEPLARPDLPLRILAESSDWLAVDKPPGQAVHPLHGDQRDTVLNAAIARYPELAQVGEGGLRGGIVHRLDVDTSGLLLLARTDAMHARLRAAFREHRMHKRYLARVRGRLSEALELDLALVIAQRRPARVRVASEGQSGRGRRRCRTQILPLHGSSAESLVEARPVSGYLHQIRVSLAHAGHPVLGDRIYGEAADRLWLHAWQIRCAELGIDVQCPPEPGFGLQV